MQNLIYTLMNVFYDATNTIAIAKHKIRISFGLITCDVSNLRKHWFIFNPNILNWIKVVRFTHFYYLIFVRVQSKRPTL